MKTLIARESDNRTQMIFKSNLYIDFTFIPVYKYHKLSFQSKWLENLSRGYFDWIIFTSFRSWKILNANSNILLDLLPIKTKVAVFGEASVKQIELLGGRVDFTVRAHNAYEFGLKFIKQLTDGF